MGVRKRDFKSKYQQGSNKKSNLLIIEDDKTLAPALSAYLTRRGYHVSLLRDGGDIDDIDLNFYDLLILDLILPGISGEDILLRVKKGFPELPVLILTAKYSISSKEECFNKGADDYLTKPFDLLELELRIKALLRRFARNDRTGKIVTIGDIRADLEHKILEKNGSEIPLSRRSWDLLEFFLQNRGTIVDKSEIMKNVWKDTRVTDDSIRTYIKELRKVLPRDAIRTYKGRGYRLM